MITLIILVTVLATTASAATQDQIRSAMDEANRLKNELLQDKIGNANSYEELQQVGSQIEQAEFNGYLTEYETSDMYVYRESILSPVDPESVTEEERESAAAGPAKRAIAETKEQDTEEVLSSVYGPIGIGGAALAIVGLIVLGIWLLSRRKQGATERVEVKETEIQEAQADAAQLSSHMNRELRNLLALQAKKEKFVKFHHKISLELLEAGMKDSPDGQNSEDYIAMITFFNELSPEQIVSAKTDKDAEDNIDVNRRALMQTNPQLARKVIDIKPEIMLMRKHFRKHEIMPTPDVVKQFILERAQRKRLVEQLEHSIEEIKHIIIHEGPTALENVAKFRKRDLEPLRLLEGKILRHVDDLVPAAAVRAYYDSPESELREHEIVQLLQKDKHNEKELAQIIQHILSLIHKLQFQLDLVGKELQKQTRDILPKQKSWIREVRKSYDAHLGNDTLAAKLAESSDELKESWEHESELTAEFIEIADSLNSLQQKAGEIITRVQEERRRQGLPEHAPLRKSILLKKSDVEERLKAITSWKQLVRLYPDKHMLYKTHGQVRYGSLLHLGDIDRTLASETKHIIPIFDFEEQQQVLLNIDEVDSFEIYN